VHQSLKPLANSCAASANKRPAGQCDAGVPKHAWRPFRIAATPPTLVRQAFDLTVTAFNFSGKYCMLVILLLDEESCRGEQSGI